MIFYSSCMYSTIREMTRGDLGLDAPDAPYAFWLGAESREYFIYRGKPRLRPRFESATNPLDGERLWEGSRKLAGTWGQGG